MEAPKAGEDCRTLYKYVDQLVKETNKLLNMQGVFEGRIRGVEGRGMLKIVGNAAELRINARGGNLDGGENKKFTNITLRSSANPSDFGEDVTFTAAVAADATGTISFYDNGVFFGSAAAPVAVAVRQGNNFPSGNHNIQALYSGDNLYYPANVLLVQHVNALQPPIAQVSAVPNPARKGIDFVKFICNVTGQNPIPPAPNITGQVAFYIDGSHFRDRPLVFLSGETWRADTSDDPINYLDFGDHEILGRYEGDNNYGAAYDTITLRVKGSADLNLTVTPSVVRPNSAVTLTCTVHHSGPAPTGTIQFFDENGNIAGPVTLVNGVATLGIGSGAIERTYHMQAHYSGDQWYMPDDSEVELLVVSALADLFYYHPVLVSMQGDGPPYATFGGLSIGAAEAYNGNVKIQLFDVPYAEIRDINTDNLLSAYNPDVLVQIFLGGFPGPSSIVSPNYYQFTNNFTPFAELPLLFYVSEPAWYDLGNMYLTAVVDFAVLDLTTNLPLELYGGTQYLRLVVQTAH